MAGEIRSCYNTRVVQEEELFYPDGENVTLLIKFEKVIGGRRRNGKYEIISRTLIGKKWQQPLNLKRAKMLANKFKYGAYICLGLAFLGVPFKELDRIVDKIFEAIYMAVSPERPIYVDIEWLIEHNLEFETPTCAICLKDFAEVEEEKEEEEEEGITSLPCAHRYHQQCIGAWLIIKPLCPLCRHPMPSKVQNPNRT